MARHLNGKTKIITNIVFSLPVLKIDNKAANLSYELRNEIMVTLGAVLYIIAMLCRHYYFRLGFFSLSFCLLSINSIIEFILEIKYKNYISKSGLAIVFSVFLLFILGFKHANAFAMFFRLERFLNAYSTYLVWINKESLIYPAPRYPVSNGKEFVECYTDHIHLGDYVGVPANNMVPVDGVVLKGSAELDYCALTGIHSREEVLPGDTVLSGAVTSNDIIVKAKSSSAESSIQRINSSIFAQAEELSEEEASSCKMGRLISAALIALVFIISVLVPIFSGKWTTHIIKGISLATISLLFSFEDLFSVPRVLSTIKLLRRGIVINRIDTLDMLGKTRTVVFNKSGTVTEKEFYVLDVCPSSVSEAALLSLIFTAEQDSKHPIAEALRVIMPADAAPLGEIHSLEEIEGQGISVIVNEKQIIRVGNAAYLERYGLVYPVDSQTGTAIHVFLNEKYCGYLVFGNRTRKEAFETIDRIRCLDIDNIVMLSSDLSSSSRSVASSLNFDLVKGELTQNDKIAAIDYLQANKPEKSTLVYVKNGGEEQLVASRADVSVSFDCLSYGKVLFDSDVSVPGSNISSIDLLLRESMQLHRLSRAMPNISLLCRLLCAIVALIFNNSVIIVCGALSITYAVFTAFISLLNRSNQ